MRYLAAIASAAFLAMTGPAYAAPEIADAALRKNFETLSASTLVGGAGWEVYDTLLHPDYSRWAMGEVYEGREKFIRSLEDWWNAGMRVAARDIELVGVDIADDFAVIRFKTTESFVSPEGPAPGFSGYVSNVWVKDDGEWKLVAAEIYSTDRNDVEPVGGE